MPLLGIVWLLLAATLNAQVIAPTVASLYVSDPLKWEGGYRPGQPAPRLADGRILLLQPDGTLALVFAYLYRSPDKQMHLLYSEGYSVMSGSWSADKAIINVRYKVIYANVPRRKPVSQPVIEESWSFTSNGAGPRLAKRIKVGNIRFIPLDNLADISALARVIEFHRKNPPQSQ